nr:hypothetical protein [Tanacetum cinerariifolium]
VDAIAWWIDSGATTHVCNDHCWFKTYEPVEEGYVLYMGDDHFAPIHGKGSVALEFSSGKTITLFNVLYVPKLRHVHYKRMLGMSKDDLILAIDENPEKCTTYDASRFCYVYLLHVKDEALDKLRIYKTEVELQQNYLIKTLRTDRDGEYYDPVFFPICRNHSMLSYTPQQNGVAERKNRALKEMVNSMLSYSDLKSRDAVFDENRFSSIPRPKDIIPNLVESQRDDHSDDVPSEKPEPRKCKRVRKAKSYVLLLRGGAISWVFKKQTCITGSTMKSEFVALAAAGARTKRTTYVNMMFCRFKKLRFGFLKSMITLKWEGFVDDFSVIDGHLGNEDLLETNEISYSALI